MAFMWAAMNENDRRSKSRARGEEEEREGRERARRRKEAAEAEARLTPEQRRERDAVKAKENADKEAESKKQEKILRKLKVLFSINTDESIQRFNSKGDIITSTVLEPPSEGHPEYAAFMLVKRRLPGMQGSPYRVFTHFQLPVNTVAKEPTLMPYLLTDDVSDTPAPLTSTAGTLINFWLPICNALNKYTSKGWYHSMDIESILSESGDTFDYQAIIRSKNNNSSFISYSTRRFTIVSRTAADGMTSFTLITEIEIDQIKKSREESRYDVNQPERMSALLDRIGKHLETRYSLSARYDAHIRHITRLLDEAE